MIQAGDDLAALINQSLTPDPQFLISGDILVLAQKIVSKAEGRQVWLPGVRVTPGAESLAHQTGKDPRLVQLILNESRAVLRARPGLIIVEHQLGFVCANAGIDHSNVAGDDEHALLLPENPDASAAKIRAALEARWNARLGILIIDSHGRAWRNGVTGAAIGISGLPGVVDKRGDRDLMGRELVATTIGAADELAGAASLLMGQAAEGTPVIHVRGFPYPLRESNLVELLRPREADLFR